MSASNEAVSLLQEQLAAARAELDRVANVCGEALGTDPEHRTAVGCAEALAAWVEIKLPELAAARAEVEILKAQMIETTENNQTLRLALELERQQVDRLNRAALAQATTDASGGDGGGG